MIITSTYEGVMKSKTNLPVIQLFTGFDEDEIEVFIGAATRKAVPKDHVFFTTGAHNSSLFIILLGSVKVERPGTAAEIPLAVLGVGQTFGEMSFMDGSRTTAAVTSTQSTEYFEISREAVDKLLEARPSIGLKLWRNFALDLKKRLAMTNQLIDQYIDINAVLLQDRSFREYYARL
jgi:CRP/FNR family cyclic AMP-dependent transcriptional regulator